MDKVFSGRVLVLGAGSVAQCSLPLILKHIAKPAQVTVIDKDDRSDRIINEIKDIDQSLLGAKFECSIALVDKSEEIELVVDGQMPGEVIKEVRGQNGFGYDPIFVPQGLTKTSSQLSDAEKDKISHRGIALRKMSMILKQLPG